MSCFSKFLLDSDKAANVMRGISQPRAITGYQVSQPYMSVFSEEDETTGNGGGHSMTACSSMTFFTSSRRYLLSSLKISFIASRKKGPDAGFRSAVVPERGLNFDVLR